jgi:hypothetical protein
MFSFKARRLAHSPTYQNLAAQSRFEREFAVSETAVLPVRPLSKIVKELAPREGIEPPHLRINNAALYRLSYLGKIKKPRTSFKGRGLKKLNPIVFQLPRRHRVRTLSGQLIDRRREMKWDREQHTELMIQ